MSYVPVVVALGQCFGTACGQCYRAKTRAPNIGWLPYYSLSWFVLYCKQYCNILAARYAIIALVIGLVPEGCHLLRGPALHAAALADKGLADRHAHTHDGRRRACGSCCPSAGSLRCPCGCRAIRA